MATYLCRHQICFDNEYLKGSERDEGLSIHFGGVYQLEPRLTACSLRVKSWLLINRIPLITTAEVITQKSMKGPQKSSYRPGWLLRMRAARQRKTKREYPMNDSEMRTKQTPLTNPTKLVLGKLISAIPMPWIITQKLIHCKKVRSLAKYVLGSIFILASHQRVSG
jgi:hypothetical protein